VLGLDIVLLLAAVAAAGTALPGALGVIGVEQIGLCCVRHDSPVW
jgi:hypothetical protein